MSSYVVLWLINLPIMLLLMLHARRTGQDIYWYILLIIFPIVGSALYVWVLIWPDWRRRRGLAGGGAAGPSPMPGGPEPAALPPAKRAALANLVDHDQALAQAQEQHALLPSVDNKRYLAELLTQKGRHDEAIGLYREALAGPLADDPDLMLELAQAQFAAGDPAGVVETLDLLREKNPDYQSPDGHLLYARSLEAQDRAEEAMIEYGALMDYYPGQEPRCRLAMLLKQRGETDQARHLFNEVLSYTRNAPRHYQDAQRPWTEMAKANLR